jgi:hypothetical protein
VEISLRWRRQEMYIQNFCGETSWKISFERQSRRCRMIKINVRHFGSEDVRWAELAQDHNVGLVNIKVSWPA